MPDEKKRADSIREYYVGAAALDAAQTDPDASIGGYPSSTEYLPLAAAVASSPGDLTIEKVGGANGPGAGYLFAASADSLQWKAPDDASYGTAVSIANGETKVLEASSDAAKFIRVTRNSADALSGTGTVTITDVYNNMYDNISSVEATAGDEYRVREYKNENAIAILLLKFWLKSLGTERTTDTAQLSGYGAGTVQTSGDVSDWPDTGFLAIQTSAAALREIVYYSALNTSTGAATIPFAGRGLLGTKPKAGASDDTALPIPGIRIDVMPATDVAAVVFSGSGLDDCTSGGTVTVKKCVDYVVEIDATGTPDTVQWSNDGGSTWEATDVSITGAAQTLENGVTVTFAGTTGHTLADSWAFTVGAAKAGADEDTEPSGLTWVTPLAAAAGTGDGTGTLSQDEICYLHIHSEVPAGAVADPAWLDAVDFSFDAS